MRFDKSGLVTERGDHNGKTSEMIYESVDGIKRLAAVKTPGQGAFLLNYGTNGRLESLKDHTGRTVRYSYEGECLTGVIYPDGTGKTYKYSHRNFDIRNCEFDTVNESIDYFKNYVNKYHKNYYNS